MKQYLSPGQTANLIELGFEKPRVAMPKFEWEDGEPQFRYTIGELIEMLPRKVDGELLEISAAETTRSRNRWMVRYPYGIIVYKDELIDALYDVILKLKEEGVI